MSELNQGTSQRTTSSRPGQMTAVMKAMSSPTGPKVLRIGVVNAGRILEERIIKQRTHVTVGSNERAMFVLQAADLPPQFKLFELIGNDYHLNFTDGMSGRVALQTGVSDLTALKSQARKVGTGYQVKLTDDARGKVSIGEITLLFQFVAPPPVQPRPQLPLSVKGGVASQIDWNLTIIAAFSFLVHFGLVGAMYSDWMDPVVNENVTAGLIDMIRSAAPPPAPEVTEPTTTATATAEPVKTAAPQQKAATPKAANPSAPDPAKVAMLSAEAEKMGIAVLGGIAGNSALAGLLKDDSAPPVDLNGMATHGSGVAQGASNGLNYGGAGGAFVPGSRAGNLQDIRGQNTGAVATGAGRETKVVPIGEVGVGATSQSVPVANAEAIIRSKIHPKAKACYQAGLADDPTQSGKVVILIKVGPSGEVESATASSNSGLSAKVEACILRAARAPQFDPPGASGSQISVTFNFVKPSGG